MSTKSATLVYRGWIIESSPEEIAGGWCAVIAVSNRDRSDMLDAAGFTPIFDDCYSAWHDGLIAGKRWVDAGLLRVTTSHLVIVSRARPEVYDQLRARFSDAPRIAVIFDRRKAHDAGPMERRASSASQNVLLLLHGFLVVPVEG